MFCKMVLKLIISPNWSLFVKDLSNMNGFSDWLRVSNLVVNYTNSFLAYLLLTSVRVFVFVLGDLNQ